MQILQVLATTMDELLKMKLPVADSRGTASAAKQDDDVAFERVCNVHVNAPATSNATATPNAAATPKVCNVCVNAPTTPNATATPNAKATPSANATRSFYEVYSYLLRKRCDRMLSDETH